MLNFDPHRWLEENAAESVAVVATVAGGSPKTEKQQVSENIGDGQNAILKATPATTATVATNPKIIAATLKEWHGKLSSIDQLKAPDGWTLDRWLTATDDACWIYESFASRAVRDGFDAYDLFGVHPRYEAMGGLAHRLHGARNLKMTAERATWSRFGVAEHFIKGAGRDLRKGGLLVIWEIEL